MFYTRYIIPYYADLTMATVMSLETRFTSTGAVSINVMTQFVWSSAVDSAVL